MTKSYLRSLALALSTTVLLSACASHQIKTVADGPNTPVNEVHSQDQMVQAANDNVRLGLAYLHRQQNVKAKEKLLLAYKQAPKQAFVLDALAYYYEKTGDTVSANKYYLGALAIDPKRPAAQNNYGAFLCRTGRYQKAEIYLLRAARNPHYVKSAAAYENAGLCALAMKAPDKARTYFKKALMQDPSRKVARQQLEQLDKPAQTAATKSATLLTQKKGPQTA